MKTKGEIQKPRTSGKLMALGNKNDMDILQEARTASFLSFAIHVCNQTQTGLKTLHTLWQKREEKKKKKR